MSERPILFERCRSEGWWNIHIGRLTVNRDSVRDALCSTRGLAEAPGYWYFELPGGFRLIWKRRWIVWGADHPYRWENIKRIDQFGTFARASPSERQEVRR